MESGISSSCVGLLGLHCVQIYLYDGFGMMQELAYFGGGKKQIKEKSRVSDFCKTVKTRKRVVYQRRAPYKPELICKPLCSRATEFFTLYYSTKK